jgi:hypothetical protein
MLTIEIYIDNLEDKQASPQVSTNQEDAKTRLEKRKPRLAKLTNTLKDLAKSKESITRHA